jgi:hypothetical protein
MGTFPRGIPREERVLASKMVRAMRGEIVPPVPQFASKLPGDTEALRGIPAIGRGVSGAMRGTVPEREVCGLDNESVRSPGLPSAEWA